MTGWRFLPIFRILLTALFVIVQYLFYLKIKSYLKQDNKPRWMIIGINVLFSLFNLPIVIFIFWRPNIQHLSSWFLNVAVYPYYIWHFSFFFLFLFFVIGKIIQTPFTFVKWLARKVSQGKQPVPQDPDTSPVPDFHPSRRMFMRKGITALAGVTFASTTFGIIRRDSYEISNISVPIQNLPDEFNGFTFALISDIHSSMFMSKERMQDYASIVNSLNADVIAVTGDFVNSMTEEVYPFAEAFSTLKAPFGVYGVLGNHDYFTREVETVAREVNACGIKILRNNKTIIEKGGKKIYLLGLDDVGNIHRASSQMDQAMSGLEQDIPKILMCHRPYFFQQAADRKIHLTLSGHTHGGQVVFMKIGNNIIAPARMVSPYVAGLYSIGWANMYVSRGIGTVGVPMRLNCPPEITKITLTKA